ncbi:ABC transporter ATP-binding protein [Amycolatopsis pithecellobii]|uniref:ATP-binding cassette domain-containing protein n=1 Tax=Amycolatopsis pithecellobii TaxID=664692 RepID=A0A6N7YK20_9PSEU|nr:ATP-binding cassette domain-containing protein [Amycolatopsis pithecellobii]MTD53255.1 ATP-binding cassette domain-containing protein [Amycolatopsis pithecellobii]
MTESKAGPASTAGIQARGLTKRYGNKVVVDDLSFTAEPGVITGFLGPNGAGKSTTMRMLLGLAKPTRGSITIGGRRIAELDDPGHTIGALLDARAVHPQRTAFDHLLAFAQAAGLDRTRAGEVLDLVGLTAAASRRAGEFSLGMKQRLGIATALLGNPGVLVFDEPLNGLDPEGIRWARTLMRNLAAEGRTILFSSHLMSEMELTADRLVVIGQGRLVAESSLEEFVRAHTTQIVTVSSPAPEDLARALGRAGFVFDRGETGNLLVTGADTAIVGKIAATEGIPLEELTWVRESLEDVFLRLTHDVTEYGSRAA